MEHNETEQLEVINQTLKEMAGIYREAVGASGISENEYWIWYALVAMEGSYSQQEICGMWSLSKQTVNTIIKNMEQKGYVTLEAVPGTRNRKNIRLTQAGQRQGVKIVLPVANAERRAIDRIPAQEQMACVHTLRKFISYLRQELDGSGETPDPHSR